MRITYGLDGSLSHSVIGREGLTVDLPLIYDKYNLLSIKIYVLRQYAPHIWS